jgi:hypothetical protein
MPLKDHALALAQKSFRIFPLIPNGKTPAIKGWQNLATVDSAQITRWWGNKPHGRNSDPLAPKGPNCNVGIATGRGLVVIDYDTKPGKRGAESLAVHENIYGLPDTMRVRTATGGLHVYLRIDRPVRNSVSKIADNVDIRGDGGLVVGPGSVIDGKTYEVL